MKKSIDVKTEKKLCNLKRIIGSCYLGLYSTKIKFKDLIEMLFSEMSKSNWLLKSVWLFRLNHLVKESIFESVQWLQMFRACTGAIFLKKYRNSDQFDCMTDLSWSTDLSSDPNNWFELNGGCSKHPCFQCYLIYKLAFSIIFNIFFLKYKRELKKDLKL